MRLIFVLRSSDIGSGDSSDQDSEFVFDMPDVVLRGVGCGFEVSKTDRDRFKQKVILALEDMLGDDYFELFEVHFDDECFVCGGSYPCKDKECMNSDLWEPLQEVKP